LKESLASSQEQIVGIKKVSEAERKLDDFKSNSMNQELKQMHMVELNAAIAQYNKKIEMIS
jgi:hypothetical protein